MRLEYLALGDSDTGNGVYVKDKGITALVAACPNLRVLMLNSATSVSDKAFVTTLEAAPKLEKLWITGHDRSHGNITKKSMKALKDRDELGHSLRELGLYDQDGAIGFGDKGTMQLSKKRKTLAIKTGDTVGDGYCASMVAMQFGGEMTCTLYNGKMVDFDFDEGVLGGYGGGYGGFF